MDKFRQIFGDGVIKICGQFCECAQVRVWIIADQGSEGVENAGVQLTELAK